MRGRRSEGPGPEWIESVCSDVLAIGAATLYGGDQ